MKIKRIGYIFNGQSYQAKYQCPACARSFEGHASKLVDTRGDAERKIFQHASAINDTVHRKLIENNNAERMGK